MGDKAEKIYMPGFIREKVFDDGGTMLKMTFSAERMIAFCHQHANAKGDINIKITRRRELGRFQETHSAVLDTWQPTPKDAPAPEPESPIDESDIPF
jgi:hypothetical protein